MSKDHSDKWLRKLKPKTKLDGILTILAVACLTIGIIFSLMEMGFLTMPDWIFFIMIGIGSSSFVFLIFYYRKIGYGA